MDIAETYTFRAPAARVWHVLLDPERLAGCIPGCQRLEPLGDGRYRASLDVGVGSIRGKYEATVTISDQAPPWSYRLTVEGSGSAGFLRGEAQVTLAEQEDGTVVTVQGKGQVGGTVARVGQRLLGSVNKMMMDRFFTCLRESAEGEE